MNPFQRAREEAYSCRTRLLGANAATAVRSREILENFEEEFDLGIEKVARGSPELGAGDACLRRLEKFIYVNRGVEPPEHVELVAHELGHWVLDAAKTPIAVTSISSASSAGGSPGVMKVEAYGARERQELQANVFAREFLMPRQVAKSLYVSGQGARETARVLGIPLKVIRQQMLDAILLPASTDMPPPKLFTPSDDQRSAARAPERHVNVVAGPGTGKTSTLIHRVKYLIEEQSVDPAHILALTFTNRAAFELVERLRATGIERAADIWAGTFHAFGLEFLRKYHDALGLKSDIVVADKLNAITMLAHNLQNLTLKRYLRIEDPYQWLGRVTKAIDRLKEELVTPEEYRAAVSALDCDDDELVWLREDVATLYESYEQLMTDAGLVDFVDLVAIPAKAIKADRARFSELADKFQYVLVDEYQDVTESMVALVKGLAQTADSLWVVGDIRQAIHHWRGASIKSMRRFEETFQDIKKSANSGAKKYPLSTNRRSSQEIVDLLIECGVRHELQETLPLDITTASAGKCEISPVLVTCDSIEGVADAIGSNIGHLRSNDIAFSKQAVLCRRTDEVEYLARKLHEREIPVLYIGELTKRPEVRRLVCLMQLLVERQPRALIGLNKLCELRLPIEELQIILDRAKTDIAWQRGRWLQRDGVDLSIEMRRSLSGIGKLLNGQSWYATPWDLLCDLLIEHRFGLPSIDDESIDAAIKRIAIWQFLHSVYAGDGDGRTPSLLRYLARLRLRLRIGENYSNRELPPEADSLDAVRMLTVHGSKGLEYDAVHIGYVDERSYGSEEPWGPPGLVTEMVPPEVLGSDTDEYKFEQAVERNNLFYVAVSRSRRHLLLYEHNDWRVKRPPQLCHTPKRYTTERFKEATRQPTKKETVTRIIADEPISYAEFDVYERCPLQHWYRFGVGLTREEDAESPVRARLAVMDAFRKLARGDSLTADEALEPTWSSYNLPTRIEDPSLWNDALLILNRGHAQLKKIGGTIVEPTCTIGGVRIIFPWVISQECENETILHLFRFSPIEVWRTYTLIRPMLAGLGGDTRHVARISNLITDVQKTAQPSVRASSTNAMFAVRKMIGGDRSPSVASHCRFCAYQTICPAKPA